MKLNLARTVIASAALSAFLFSTQALAWSVTTTGVVGAGRDSLGSFFAGGNADLSGQVFTLVTTFDPGMFPYQDSDLSLRAGYGGGVPFSVSLSLNNLTKTFVAENQYGSYTVINALTQGVGSNPADFVGLLLSYLGADGKYINVNQVVSSVVHPMNLALSFDQTWAYTPQMDDQWQGTSIEIHDQGVNLLLEVHAQFGYGHAGSLTNISISPSGSGVPEPGSMTLMGLGVGALALLRRKVDGE